MMDFNQGEFNFDARGDESGFRKWREELDAKKRDFETRWGVILGKTVEVSLREYAKPLTGTLEWIDGGKDDEPRFRIRRLEFAVSEIESIRAVESACGE